MSETIKHETRLEKWSKQFMAFLKIFTTIILSLATVVIIIVSVIDIRTPTIYIEPFEVPEYCVKQGLSGTVLSNMIIDEVYNIKEATQTNAEIALFPATRSETPEIRIPGSDISLKSFLDFFRKNFGSQKRFIGEIYKTESLYLNIRTSNTGSLRISAKENQLDSLIFLAASYIYKNTQPCILAVYYAQKENYELAEQFIEYELINDSKEMDCWAYNIKGSIRLLKRDYKSAENYFTEAINLKLSYAMAYCGRGYLFAEIGDTIKALADFNKAVKLEPKDARVYYYRGSFFKDKNKTDLAMQDYNKAIKIDPKDSDLYNARGILFKNMEDRTKAMFDYNKAIELNSKNGPAYYNRGYLLVAMGDTIKGIMDYSKIIEINPTDYLAYYKRALLYNSIGKEDSATADFNQGLKLDPDPKTHFSSSPSTTGASL